MSARDDHSNAKMNNGVRSELTEPDSGLLEDQQQRLSTLVASIAEKQAIVGNLLTAIEALEERLFVAKSRTVQAARENVQLDTEVYMLHMMGEVKALESERQDAQEKEDEEDDDGWLGDSTVILPFPSTLAATIEDDSLSVSPRSTSHFLHRLRRGLPRLSGRRVQQLAKST